MRRLSETETANGFGNRFLWIHVRRTQSLAFGGNLHGEDFTAITERIRDVLQLAKDIKDDHVMTFDRETAPHWKAFYDQHAPLSDDDEETRTAGSSTP